jgi:hypothetical protein
MVYIRSRSTTATTCEVISGQYGPSKPAPFRCRPRVRLEAGRNPARQEGTRPHYDRVREGIVLRVEKVRLMSSTHESGPVLGGRPSTRNASKLSTFGSIGSGNRLFP